MRRILLTVALLSMAAHAAAEVVIPSDESLVGDSRAIAVGVVESLRGDELPDGDIGTIVRVRIESVFKGPLVPRETIEVHDLGGVVGDRAMFVSNAVTYWPGARVLLFLDVDGTGQWTTWGQILGKFDFVTTPGGTRLLIRGSDGRSLMAMGSDGFRPLDGPRLASLFLQFIDEVVAGRNIARNRPSHVASLPPASNELRLETDALIAEANAYPPSAYTSGNYRWQIFDSGGTATYYVNGSQPGYDSIGIAQRALAAWTNDPNSNVRLQYGGTRTNGFVQDGVNTIVYNSPNAVPGGALGFAKWYANATHTYKGETFYSINEGDVAIRSGVSPSASVMEEAVTHEVGHTLGFRHSDQGTPASSNAVMNSVVNGSHGSSLGPWDIEAVTAVYGSGAAPPPPPPPTPRTNVRGDFNGDSRPDLLWRNTASAANAVWFMNGTMYAGNSGLPSAPAGWTLGGAGDFDGDADQDLFWRNSGSGQNAIWIMNGTSFQTSVPVASADPSWTVGGIADFNGDSRPDIAWRNTSGQNAIWIMNGAAVLNSVPASSADPSWRMEAVADLNLDGKPDFIWRNSASGQNAVWHLNGAAVLSSAPLPPVSDPAWRIQAAGDYNGDGRVDLVWRNMSSGQNAVWFMNNTTYLGSGSIPSVSDRNFMIAGPR